MSIRDMREKWGGVGWGGGVVAYGGWAEETCYAYSFIHVYGKPVSGYHQNNGRLLNQT